MLALLMIAMLGLIGISSTQISTTETKISRNDRLYKMCLHDADGATEAGVELVEQNIEERGFQDRLVGANCYYGNVAIDTGDVDQSSLKFFLNPSLAASGAAAKPAWASASRDATIPRNATGLPPITNMMVGGRTDLSTGGAIQMIAGYEGKGKSAAGGGAWITYDIRARHQDVDNSDSTVNLGWRHVM